MFNSGEYDVFEKAGFSQVFYGDVLVGSRLPCLTYMLGFTDLTDRTAQMECLPRDAGVEETIGFTPVRH